jgi:hypothetical protein
MRRELTLSCHQLSETTRADWRPYVVSCSKLLAVVWLRRRAGATSTTAFLTLHRPRRRRRGTQKLPHVIYHAKASKYYSRAFGGAAGAAGRVNYWVRRTISIDILWWNCELCRLVVAEASESVAVGIR